MLQNSSDVAEHVSPRPSRSLKRKWLVAIVLPLWVLISFLLAQQLVIALIWLLRGLDVPLGSLNESVLTTVLAAVIYLVTVALVIGVPRLAKKQRVTAEEIGLHRLPLWKDILMAPAGLIVYVILSAVLMLLATLLLPAFDANQAQDTGFTGLSVQYEYLLAFATLVVIAPVAEEVLFRGYLFGKLRKFVPVWVAIVVTSILFGLIHGAWNLAIDTFALSIILCLLRITTGSLWAPILLHMAKNGIAFYILFVNPLL